MKKIRTCLFLAVVILTTTLICACSQDDEFDVIGDLKDVVFEDFGSQTLGEAVNSTLSNVKWSYDDTPSYDEGTCYDATLKGVFKEDGTEIKIGFKVLYKYRTRNYKQEWEATVEYFIVDGEVYNDTDSIITLLDILYGNS